MQREYTVVLTYDSEDDAWLVSFPGFKNGQYATFGETREQALEMAVGWLEITIWGMIQDGVDVPVSPPTELATVGVASSSG